MEQHTTHFGNKIVDVTQKEHLVRDVFDSVANRYDLMNDVMSAGIHRLWKRRMIAAIPLYHNMRLLDLAGGTGDIALRFLQQYNNKFGQQKCQLSRVRNDDIDLDSAIVTVCDINPKMLAEGEKRAIDSNLISQIDFIEANAEKLPFTDNYFDTCCIAFGIRNVTNISNALNEIYRVLKPTGKFICLEFSHVQNELLRALYDKYSYNVIPAMGQIIADDKDSYQYLVESIRKFPDADTFADMIDRAGFAKVNYELLTNGVVALHWGWKM